MGRTLLVARLAARNLRRRTGEAAMLAAVLLVGSTALTLGLVLHGVSAQPYQETRAATAGPDVLATAFPLEPDAAASRAALASVQPLAHARGVVAHSGPFPVAFPVLRANGHVDAVLAEGRSTRPAPVDQPVLTAGSWVRSGGIVLERSFAEAVGVHAGDRVTVNGRPFTVAGIAVTAAFPANGVGFLEGSARWPNPGLIWMTEPDARAVATAAHPLGYVLNLKLAHPAGAGAFADRFDPGGYNDNTGGLFLIPWQSISHQDGLLVRYERKVLLVSSGLLAALAIGSLAVLVGGRMAEQTRRVGSLKAVGGTPGLVAAVLLAEYLALALAAAVVGVAAGWLAAPLLTGPGTALLGSAGAPQLTLPAVAVVVAVALTVTAMATLVPALRAARISTVRALSDAPRQPRRRAWLVAHSARLPVTLLLAARLGGRRPRRLVLNVLAVAVTVAGIVAILVAHATLAVSQFGAVTGSGNPSRFDVGFGSQAQRENEVLLIVTVMLAALAAVNAIVLTRATVQDSRHATGVTRALGATCAQLAAGISAAQILPALAGAVIGIPAGFGLFALADQGGSASQPPTWWLVVTVAGTVGAVAGLTFLPARAGTRHPVGAILRSEV